MISMVNSIITIEIVPDHNLGINNLSVLGSETLLASNLFLKKYKVRIKVRILSVKSDSAGSKLVVSGDRIFSNYCRE